MKKANAIDKNGYGVGGFQILAKPVTVHIE
jgi:hypothetical protein